MGYVLFDDGYHRPSKTYSPAEEQFQQTWLQMDTPVTLIREFRQDVRMVSSVCRSRYIDFAHSETRTAIEIDGNDHLDRQDDDRLREWELQQLGWNILRFTNTQIWKDPHGCAIIVQEHINTHSRMTPAYWPLPALRPSQPGPQQHRALRVQQFRERSPQKAHPRLLAFWWAFFSGIITGALASLSIPLGPLPTGLLLSVFAFFAGFLTGKVTPRRWAGAITGLLAGSIYAAFLSSTIYAPFAPLPLAITPLIAFLAASLASKKRSPRCRRSADK